MIPYQEQDFRGLRIGKEGITRSLVDRFAIKDSRNGGGLYMSNLFVPTFNVDELMDRPRIDGYTEAVSANGTKLMYTVAPGTQETWLAYRGQANVGTFDYQLLIQASSRDGNHNMHFEDAVAATAQVRQQFGHPFKLGMGWTVNMEITNLAVAGNVFLRVWKLVRVWQHYDGE